MKEISQADFMPIDRPMSLILSTINGFSSAFGSLGNLALIMVIILHKQLHGASEILLISLAFTDLVTCAVYIPLLLIRINTSHKLPTAMNQLRRAIGQTAIVCGILTLLMLTVDRLIFFYRPLRYKNLMRKRVVLATIAVIFSISLFVGYYAYYDMIKSQYPKLGFVGAPLVIFFVLHYAIFRLAQTHRNRLATQEQSLQHNYKVVNTVIVQARRNARTVMIFGVLYLLTWLPVTIFQLWRTIKNYHDAATFQKYFYLLLTIQQISSCVNPYLCCTRNKKVKAVIKKLLPFRKDFMRKIGVPLGKHFTSKGRGNRRFSRNGAPTSHGNVPDRNVTGAPNAATLGKRSCKAASISFRDELNRNIAGNLNASVVSNTFGSMKGAFSTSCNTALNPLGIGFEGNFAGISNSLSTTKGVLSTCDNAGFKSFGVGMERNFAAISNASASVGSNTL